MMEKHSDDSTTVSTFISSFEVEDDIDAINILSSMECEHFSKLREYFFTRNLDLTNNVTSGDRDSITYGSLARNEFIVSMENIFNHRPGAGIGAAKVFDEIDDTRKGWITWKNFLDLAVVQMCNKEPSGRQKIISPKPTLHRKNNSKREGTIVKIILMKVEAGTNFLMVTVGGMVSIYDGSLEKVLDTFTVPLSGIQETSGASSSLPSPDIPKMAKPWITDAILMEDTNQVVFATSDRCLHFRDVGGRGSPWVFHVTGLRNAPTCLAYCSSNQLINKKLSKAELERDSMKSEITCNNTENNSLTGGNSVLHFGDDEGNIWSLKFLQPSESLFHRFRRKGEGAEHIYWLELENSGIMSKSLEDGGKRLKSKISNMSKVLRETVHHKYVEINVMRNVHANAVSKISFRFEAPHAVISCSGYDRFPIIKKTSSVNGYSKGGSLVLQPQSSQASPYVFKIPSGIRCFDLWDVKERKNVCDSFLLATGSRDALIRLWNPYVPQMTVATLAGHINAIEDLIFIRLGILLLLFSVCSSSEIRVWKMNSEEYCCLQVVQLNISPMKQLSRKHEFGSKVLYIYQNQNAHLLVACDNEFAILPFEHVGRVECVGNTESETLKVKLNDENEDQDLSSSIMNDLDLDAKIRQDVNVCSQMEDSMSNFREEMKSYCTMQERIFTSTFEKFSQHSKNTRGKNECQSLQERYKKEMKKYVSVCAPHLALPTYPPMNVSSQLFTKRFSSFNKFN